MAISELEKVLADFKTTLDLDVKSLRDLHDKDSGNKGRPGRWLDALKRASIVLLTANLENYVENLVCEGLLYLCKNKVRARKYPETYRYWIFKQEINMRNLSVRDSKDVIELSMKLWNDIRELQESELKLDEIKDEFANPTPKNVNWIMGLLDYENYLDGLNINVLSTSVSAKSTIGEIAKRRNDIAHGDITQVPTLDDLERLVKFSQLFANRMQKDVTSKIQSCLKA